MGRISGQETMGFDVVVDHLRHRAVRVAVPVRVVAEIPAAAGGVPARVPERFFESE
jgi:hypothetical protein